MLENELTQIVIGKAIEVHNDVGPGVLEHVYKEYLAMLLQESGLHVDRKSQFLLLEKV